MKYKIGLKIKMLDNLIQKKVCRLLNQTEVSDLTYMNFWIIGFVKEHYPDEVYQKDIERGLSVNRATASRMLTTMERKGLLLRKKSEKDGRLRKIVLEPQALKYYEYNRKIIDELEETLTKGITEDELKTFLKIYHKMADNLKK